MGHAWPPHGQALKAGCAGSGHDAPRADCSCGVYAWHPTADNCEFVFPSRRWTGSITGIVEAWGETEVHADGFRAQYARPRWLLLPSRADRETRRQVETLAAEYGAEVLPVPSAQELRRWCRHHDLGLAPSVVARLLGHPQGEREARPDAVRPTAVARAPDPPAPPGRLATALRRARASAPGAGERALEALAVLAACAFYGAIVGVPAYLVLEGDDPPPAGTPGLRIVAQRILPREGGSLYIAVVENAGRRTAAGVVPEGEFQGRSGEYVGEPHSPEDVWMPATIPPGGRAVVVDWLDDSGSGVARGTTRYAIRMRADGGLLRGGHAPARVRAVRIDRRRFLAWGTVTAERPMREVELALLGRDRRGRIAGYLDGVAGPLRRGASRQVLARLPPLACERRGLRLSAYPTWRATQLRAGSPARASGS